MTKKVLEGKLLLREISQLHVVLDAMYMITRIVWQ
jgi:hypothetical protein